MLKHSHVWVWHAGIVAAVLWIHIRVVSWGKKQHPWILSYSYVAHIQQAYFLHACVSEFFLFFSPLMARVESNPDHAECAGEPEGDEVSWSISLGCLAGSERNVSPAGKAALLTSEPRHLTPRTCLFTFHKGKGKKKGWCGVARWTRADAILVELWQTTTRPCTFSQNVWVGFNSNKPSLLSCIPFFFSHVTLPGSVFRLRTWSGRFQLQGLYSGPRSDIVSFL